jgi:4-amino-4-deoxy-L-arabinose transferase-like glycosyltransferase
VLRSPLLAILLWGLILRLAAVALIHPTRPLSAEAIYSFRAMAWEQAAPMAPDFDRPPGVIYFFRLLVLAFGESSTVLRIGNAILGALFLLLVYAWSRRLAGERVALMTSFLTASHPEIISFGASLWSEQLYLFLIYAAFLLFLRAPRPMSVAQSILLGFVLALACLTRDIGLFLVPFVLLDFVRGIRARPGPTLAGATAFLLAFALTILPRSMEMTRRSGDLVLITALNESRLYVGNVDVPGAEKRKDKLAIQLGEGVQRYGKLSQDPLERRKLAKKAALDAIEERLPQWPLEKSWREISNFLTPNSFVAMRLLAQPQDPGFAGRFAYEFSTEAIDRKFWGIVLGAIAVVFSVATLLSGTFGISLVRLGGAAFPLLAFSIAHFVPTLITISCSRFRLPLLPIFLLGAAAMLVNGRRLWKEASPRRRLAACAALLLALVILAQRIETVYPPQLG